MLLELEFKVNLETLSMHQRTQHVNYISRIYIILNMYIILRININSISAYQLKKN